MKYNWPAVVKEFRTIMLENVQLYTKASDKTPSKALMDYLHFNTRETDNFHPWNTDGELSKALENMPLRCNYRSCHSYWAYKDGRDDIDQALYDVFDEMQEIIQEYFTNAWNFRPGFVLPEKIVFSEWHEVLTERMLSRIIRAAKSS